MGHSCCGGGCSNHKHEQRRPAGSRALQITAAGALLAIVGVSAIALTTIKPEQAQAPATPAQSQPAAPASVPTDVKPTPPAKPALPATEGVIRHGRKDPLPKPAGAVRLATYNIENLYDTEWKGSDEGRITEIKPAAHRQAIADAIRAIDADILALQEIQSKEVLEKFNAEYLKGMGYTFVASLDAGDPRGIEQSVLSRFPISNEKVWPRIDLGVKHPEKLGRRANPDAGKPIIMARSPMHATVEVPAAKTGSGKPYALTLFVVHQKSGAFYSYQREAEALGILKLAKDPTLHKPSDNIVILGDFNARPSEKSVQTYVDAGFVDAFGDLTKDEPAEFITHVSGRAIDHIMVSPSLRPELVNASRFVLGTMQRPDGVDWRSTSPPPGYGSDHYPVVIDIMPVDVEAPKPAPTATDKPAP